MRLAGHKSMAMTERYSRVENVIDFQAVKQKMSAAMSARPGRAAGD